MKIAEIDVDGVVANFEEFIVLRLEEEFGDRAFLNRHLYSFEERFEKHPEMVKRAAEIVARPSSYIELEPIENGVNLVNKLIDSGVSPWLVSSRPKYVEDVHITSRWLSNYFNLDKCLGVVCGVGNKAEFLKGQEIEFAVDDSPLTVESLNKSGILTYCFDQPWNQDVFPRIEFDREGRAWVWEAPDKEEYLFEFAEVA